jgi:hypothetical protein
MFIVREPKKNRLQPRRGGMGPLGACHAALTGLKTVVGVRGAIAMSLLRSLGPVAFESARLQGPTSQWSEWRRMAFLARFGRPGSAAIAHSGVPA